MKIIRIESWPVSMRLAEPYATACERIDVATNVLLRLETNQGVVGYGFAAPDQHVTGETAETALRSIIDVVDMALFDILGKKANLPLWRLLGGFRDRIRTSVSIGILTEDETVKRAREWITRGFRCLKLKGGVDVQSDIGRVLRVREAVGGAIELRFDANQGFSVEYSLEFVEKTRNARLELIEQPTPKGKPDLLGRVTGGVSIPVMADESLITLRDAFRIARYGLADMVNVKLMKVGGISEALQINAVALSAGLEVMVGCMDETALAIGAGLHFALARPNVIYADLDGHLGLLEDPTAGAVILRSETLFPRDRPGLGLDGVLHS